jgi:hypothetical protein
VVLVLVGLLAVAAGGDVDLGNFQAQIALGFRVWFERG